MIKKIAAGADAIVLGCENRRGRIHEAQGGKPKHLHILWSGIGKQVGRNTMAIISDMSQPLGFAIGNSLKSSKQSKH